MIQRLGSLSPNTQKLQLRERSMVDAIAHKTRRILAVERNVHATANIMVSPTQLANAPFANATVNSSFTFRIIFLWL